MINIKTREIFEAASTQDQAAENVIKYATRRKTAIMDTWASQFSMDRAAAQAHFAETLDGIRKDIRASFVRGLESVRAETQSPGSHEPELVVEAIYKAVVGGTVDIADMMDNGTKGYWKTILSAAKKMGPDRMGEVFKEFFESLTAKTNQ